MAAQDTTSDWLPDGTPVRYHGHHGAFYGHYTAHPCPCHLCLSAVLEGRQLLRYELCAPASGEPVAWHIPRRDVTPTGVG